MSEEEQRSRLRKLYPQLSDDKIEEARLHIEGYLRTVIATVEREDLEQSNNLTSLADDLYSEIKGRD
jgi:hypothetical protein